MAQDSNIVKSTLNCKCPKCHEGDLFLNTKTYQFKNFLEIHDNCKACDQDFQIEAGFYLGAMFVSYALTVAICVAVFVAFITFNAYSLIPYLIATGISLTLLTPYTLRLSRSIWITFSVRYDPNAIKKYAAQNKNK